MKHWTKWLVPIACTCMFFYSIWALREVDRTITDYEARIASCTEAEAETETGTEAAALSEEEPEEITPEAETKAAPEAVLETEPQHLGTFKLTAYCSCPKCCGEWADGVTYTGTEATEGRTIAVDPDVIPLGSSVYIDGREYVAEDIGGAIQGNRIDVFFDSHSAALEFGVQYTEISIN